MTNLGIRGLARLIPALAWLPRYDRNDLRGDVGAGLTVAVMLIPQGMAYATLAGLPPLVGLYASTVPLLVYALLGSSRQLAVGPAAMVSLLVLSSVSQFAEPGSSDFLGYAIVLSVLVGVIQLAMGALRLGFAVRLLARPVVSGFASAVAVIVVFSQIDDLLGLELSRSSNIATVASEAAGELGQINVGTSLVAGLTILALVVARRRYPAIPAALGVVVAGTLAAWLLGLEAEGVSLVGSVPPGLPVPSLPSLDLETAQLLAPSALLIATLGFVQSIGVAKAMAQRHRHEVDANQELLALGGANLAGSFFGGYPVMGGFARTAVNEQAGAKTQLSAIVTALAVGVTLLFLTPLFYHLPKAVLAGIIVVAVSSLIDLGELKRLLAVRRSDAGLMLVTFASTLIVGLELGVVIGVATSLAMFIARTTRPHTAVLGGLPGRPGVYRNVRRFDEARVIPGILIVRIDATFYFANMDFLKSHLARLEQERNELLLAVIVDASSVNDLDSSAVTALQEIATDYASRGIRLFFAAVKGPVRDVMARAGFTTKLGKERFAFTIQEAVERATADLPSDAGPKSVPPSHSLPSTRRAELGSRFPSQAPGNGIP